MEKKEAILSYEFPSTATAVLEYINSDIDTKGFCLICDVMDRFKSGYRNPLFAKPMGWNKPINESSYITESNGTWKVHVPYPSFVNPVRKDANEYEFWSFDELCDAIFYVRNLIKVHGFCSVYQLNSELGIPNNAGTENVGWTSLSSGITIREMDDEYWVAILPKPKQLDQK